MSSEHPQKVNYLGKVDYRNKQLTFGIKEKDRTRHMYVIGKTGMGKSTLLENMAIQDIVNGDGVCVIDPHGSMAEKLLDYIPKERIDDVIYFAPFDTEYPLGLNVLEKVDFSKRHLVANGLMSAFKKIFGEDRFSDRIQYILNNIILSLLECEGESLLGVNRMLNDKDYRKYVISNIKDPSVRSFWLEEYAKAGEKYQQEAAPGIQNKIGQFISNPLIRNIIGQKNTAFDIRDVMDNKKILIVNLSKGKVGEGNANLIGSLLITKIYLAAMSRADAGVHSLDSLPPFYFYVDEFQNFANDSFANILSEARKYNLALTVAHQYIEQMTDEVKAAVFGNVGTMITFRVGATDAEAFEKEFAPYFTMDDIVNLSAFQVYLRLMIDGVGSKPFSAQMLPPIKKPEVSYAQEIIERSREKYAKKLSLAEEEVRMWYEPKVVVSDKTETKPEFIKEVKAVELKSHVRDTYGSLRKEEKKVYGSYTDERRQSAGKYEQRKEVSDRYKEPHREERREEKKESGPEKVTNQTRDTTTVLPEKDIHIVKHEQTQGVQKEILSSSIDSPSLADRIRLAQEETRKKEVQPAADDSVTMSASKTVQSEKSSSEEAKTSYLKNELLFDNAKPTSLKEALSRAMKEKDLAISEISARENHSMDTQTDSHDSHKKVSLETEVAQEEVGYGSKKEVSARILNPLIKDEELDTLLRNEE